MALYELGADKLIGIEQTTFAVAKVKERADLQRLLRTHIAAIVPDGMVLCEEFGDWDDSSRRIDLLVLDRDANLVVVELKRSEDGGHMELQAVRYAAMVSSMTWNQAVEAHARYLRSIENEEDAAAAILNFLELEEPDEENFANEVRIVLASADFSRELTTSVLWLNQSGLDIRCVRMVPYSLGERTLIDIQQVIPLPEAEEYQIRVREKAVQERAARHEMNEKQSRHRQFWTQLLDEASKVLSLHQNISPAKNNWISASSCGLSFNYVIQARSGRVTLYIGRKSKLENKAIFDELYASKDGIEAAFGGQLEWQRHDGNLHCRVFAHVDTVKLADESTWPAGQANMIETMRRLHGALNPYVKKYREGASPVVAGVTAVNSHE